MKTQNPLIGRSRKSFGDATFYTLNGQNIVRTKATVVANPNTPAQEAQRVRFKAFTAAANSLSEVDLTQLFATKEKGRNRRSMLQSQLAPAYGTQENTDPSVKERFVATFDVEKLGTIGSGQVGYEGDLVTIGVNGPNIAFSDNEISEIVANMVDVDMSDRMLFVVISQDGCLLKIVDSGKTIEEVVEAAGGSSGFSLNIPVMQDHGTSMYCYALAASMETTGLGTFAVAIRKARKGHNPKHNIPV